MSGTADDRMSTRRDFPALVPMTTRWADNDMFGHLNNATYFQLFDTAINAWVIEHTGTDPLAAPAMPVVAESSCRFFREVGFPQPLEVGLRVAHLGRSSVVYELGLFGDADPSGTVSALGRWVHVYLDKATRTTTAIPDAIRSALADLQLTA